MKSTASALEFLKRFDPVRLVVLTAISVKGEVVTKTFENADAPGLFEFIESRQGYFNLYFSVNPVRKAVTRKASKGDISAMEWLHVDCDPESGEPLAVARKTILERLTAYRPAPTVLIDSGGGYQAFWRLKDSEPIKSEAHIEELEGYNKALGVALHGDKTHNIDRIMRLPGTLNIPNARKQAAGRKQALASVVWFNSYVYELRNFGSLSPASADPQADAGDSALDINALGLDSDIVALIRTGANPKYPSRSEAVFAVACGMVRAGLTTSYITSVLLNKAHGISASVLENKKPAVYAKRQALRARDTVISPELAELNEIHCVVKDAGKTKVLNEAYDPAFDRMGLTKSSFTDFTNFYRNRRMDKVRLGNWWLDHPQRRQYDRIVFSPKKNIEGAYNLWRGFAVEPTEGNWGLFRAHIYKNICAEDTAIFRYLMGWMARAVQYPDTQGQVAVVMRGAQGTGKSFFAKTFGKLFGQHFLHIGNTKHLVGAFNAHLRDCVVLFSDEAFWAGDKQGESVLKTLVTEDTITIEAKGVDAVSCPNYIHLLMASNHDWVIPAGAGERRFFVMDVGTKVQQDREYFTAIDKQMTDGGAAALLYDLMAYDISSFDVSAQPRTAALLEQKMLSMTLIEKWWLGRLTDGFILKSEGEWPDKIQRDDLQANFFDELNKAGFNRRGSHVELSVFMKKVLPGGELIKSKEVIEQSSFDPMTNSYMTYTLRKWVYWLPSLKDCQASFSRHLQSDIDWDTGEKQGIL